MLKAVAVVIVPVQVLNVLITLSLPDTTTTAGATTTTSDSEWAGVAALLATAVAAGIGLVALPLLFAGRDNELVYDLANGVFGAAASVLTIPFVAAVVAVIYFDLRVRKEGFDLQLMAQRIGAPAGSVRPTLMPWTQPVPGAGGGWAPPPPGWQSQPPSSPPATGPPPGPRR